MAKQRTAQLVGPAKVLGPLHDRFYFHERFSRKPGLNADILNATESTRMIANPDFEVLGTNMTSALSTFSTGGGITLTTAGADGDGAILLPHLDTNQSTLTVTDFSTDDEVAFSVKLVTGASIANAIIWMGLKLTNTPTTATDDDQVMFRYEDDVNSGRWQLITSVGGTDTATDGGTVQAPAVAASTAYDLGIAIDNARKPHFSINGEELFVGAALTTGVDLIPYVGVEADGAAAAKAISIRHWTISKEFND